MKFVSLLLLVFAIYILQVDSAPTDDDRKTSCRDTCRDDEFDRLICAFDGIDLRYFSGSCRMAFYNDCYRMGELRTKT
jgi:hypothetical protein